MNLSAITDSLIRELNQTNGRILKTFPIKRFLHQVQKAPRQGSYGDISPGILGMSEQIKAMSNSRAQETYHKLMLVELIRIARDRLEQKRFPADVNALYQMNFTRIIKDLKTGKQPSGFYQFQEDKFLKDFGICRMFLIPAGAQKIHPTRMKFGFLFKRGIGQFFKGVSLILFQLNGYQPIFDMHTDSHDPDLMADFNPEGWKRFYWRTARILKADRRIKGIFGISWFFDPALEKISPRLAYLRKIVADNGGQIFYMGASSNSVRNATMKSATRRSLYNKGRYQPTSYMIVWPRKQLIRWANQYENTGNASAYFFKKTDPEK